MKYIKTIKKAFKNFQDDILDLFLMPFLNR